jgi:glycosyltransferase involved in cell wall biosynthesis
MVGITSNVDAHPVGRWQPITIGGRQIGFLPVVAAQPGRARGVPLSAKVTWALMRSRRDIDLEDGVLTFHRIEPTLAVRSLRAPTVLFLHAHSKDLHNPMTEVTWRKAPGLYHWLEGRLIPGVAHTFIVREDAAADYRSRYPALASRIQFLPTWVDEDVFASWPEARRQSERRMLADRYGLDRNRRWVLFIGRFEGQKDPLLLLEAVRRLNALEGSTQLIMIGSGTLEPQIKAHIAQHKLGDIVRLLHPQPQPELVRWLNAGDCLCLSSAFEGMPLVVLEALQCGVPVVSTATGQTPRILREPAGVVVHERTPEALGLGLARLLSRRPDRAACQRAAAPYTARKALEQVYATYREVHAARRQLQ